MLAASVAEAGGHRGYPQPVYLVPATPVVAYAPASVAYAPVYPPAKHHFKARPYAVPVSTYAAPAAFYGYAPAAPAPAVYNVVSYAAPAPAAAAPAPAAVATYQWQLVKTSSNAGAAPGLAAASPGTDSAIPTLSDLTPDQNTKLRQLLKDHLSTLSGTALNPEKKQSSMIEWATDTYADLLGVGTSTLTSAQQENARKIALAILGNPAEPASQSMGSSENTPSNAPQGYATPVGYQLYLPVAGPGGGLFHHKKR